MIRHGGCLCGGVRFQTAGEPVRVAVCHCRYCQLRSGSAFGITVVFPTTCIEIKSGSFDTYTYQTENDSGTNLVYDSNQDLAQATGFQNLAASIGSDNDQGLSGSLRIFNPSSTTFVKHFIGETHISSHENLALHFFIGGYFNTTADITAMQFKMSSGNIDSGTITLYGIN